MSKINFDNFVKWAEGKFDRVVVKGTQVKVPSIFQEDRKTHLECNPDMYDYGCYHCWKSDESGTLVSLVMQVEKCTFKTALDILGGRSTSLWELEKKVQELFNNHKSNVIVDSVTEMDLPPFTKLIAELPKQNKYRIKAEEYLEKRKIPSFGLFICCEGEYRDRIIIPYYGKSGELIYWNGRYIGNNDKALRYQGPKDLGIGKESVLFCPDWPASGERIYLTEGEFDTMILRICGFYSGAFGGKFLSDKQLEMLKDYKLTLCLDSDDAGRDALPRMGDKLLAAGFTEIEYVRPPKQQKDWNEMFLNLGENLVVAYINTKKKQYDSFASVNLKGNAI